jgi:phosphoribosylaminoimidazolecarboxamide formyltransferase / IMP cyclohydrolase
MIANDGAVSEDLLTILAARAFSRTAAYDSAISTWFADQLGEKFPRWLSNTGTKKQDLRYGENPHQEAALYLTGDSRPGVATAQQVQGKELSYNNINDTDAAFELVAEFEQPAVAIIKHANPCGVAVAGDCLSAYAKALACDPVSAFGGIVALNRPLDEALALKITELFTEVVIAPEADDAAKKVFSKKKNLRLLLTGSMPDVSAPARMIKPVAGGLLAQTKDTGHIRSGDLKVVTAIKPSEHQIDDMLFAFTIAKHVKSNTIVYAKKTVRQWVLVPGR